MLFGARIRCTLLKPLTGLFVALFVMQLVSDILPAQLQWPIVQTVEAATDVIRPDGDGSVQGTQTLCGVGGNFTCVDEVVTNPTAPNTTVDFVTLARNEQDFYTMGTVADVSSATQVDVQVFHVEGGTNMRLDVSLWDATESTQYGTTQNLSTITSSAWEAATFSGLSLSQSQLDGMRVRLNCTRFSGGSPSDCTAYAMYADITFTPVTNVTLGTSGTQQNVDRDSTNNYIGSSFSIEGTIGTRDITDITIAEQGTVDGSADISNIKLFYDTDTSSPYDCASESYAGTETQYGSTDTDGFDAANGDASFSATGVTISPTQTLCVYVVMDVGASAASGETIEVQITDPETDVLGTGTMYITPATAVALPGSTVVEEAVIEQANYHWRNDDGTESGATSATGGSENTAYSSFPDSATKRIRFAVSNEGNKTTDPAQYRLEYSTTSGACNLATGWTDVGAGGGDFAMSNTANLTDGNNTTNIAVSSGGVSNPNTTFLTPNAAVKDTSSQTANITLTSTQYVELEYAIIGSGSLTAGQSYCFRVTDAGTELDTYTNYPEATISADAELTGIGSETTSVLIPSTGQNAGGAFMLVDNITGANTLSSVTIQASGTVDTQNDISNITLRYDLDVSAPHDCVSESYSNTDSTFGATVASLNGSDQATFTGSVAVSPTATICMYVEFDVSADASNGELLDWQVNNPSSDITLSGSTVAPAALVDIPGTASFEAPFLEQRNYHWRFNDGTEASATSHTGGTENTILADLGKNSPVRLRMAVENTGPVGAPATPFQLEWGERTTSCSDVTLWTAVGSTTDKWDMSNSGNLTEGANTTNIAVSTGGVSNTETTFVTANGGVRDTTDTVAAVAIGVNSYTELEFSIVASDDVTQGSIYCFRVTNNGTPIDGYTQYPQVSIAINTDFKIQRGVVTITGDTLTITAGTDYETPASINSAFIRITNSQITGAGPNTGNSNNNADDVTAYISNPGNLLNNITFSRGTGAAGNSRVYWEIIEYVGAIGGENEMLVRQHGTVSYTTTGTTVTTASTTVSDDADIVVFITGQFNPNTSRNNYPQSLSTAAWNAGADTATFTRGATGGAVDLSYAVVEYTGSNWKVQRAEHTYTAAGSTETETITSVNSRQRAFVVGQKRTSETNHADFGHEVWLSGLGQVSFLLDSQAANPANHTSVAWVIENTQTQGLRMVVTRSNGALTSTGSGPESNIISIGKTIFSLGATSIFVTNFSDETSRSWPEPILGVTITSQTQYELWRSDSSANVDYRTAIVEWPSAERTIVQNYYRLYVDNNALTPTDPWPEGGTDLGENTEMTAFDDPMSLGSTTRIRMSISVSNAAVPSNVDAFRLQYALRTGSCGDPALTWHELGGVGSTTEWRALDNTPVSGTALSTDPPTGGDLLLSPSTVAGTYQEAGVTPVNVYSHFPGDDVEYDWVVQHNGAADRASYCFRMVEFNGELFQTYVNYPVLRTLGFDPRLTNWRWYDDETNATPNTALAAENTAPTNVQNQNAIKLRTVFEEFSNAVGTDVKFSVQFSEYADFSQDVFTAASSTACTGNSLWCYFDGAGVDNATIQGTVISDADTCVLGVGDGCGTHNESISTTTATRDQQPLTSMEYEFTIKHDGARAGTVYYFRLFDENAQEPVPLSTGSSYPSLVTEGAQLVFAVAGVNAGVVVAGETTDATTTPAAVTFGVLPIGTSAAAAQQLSVTTNATEGYQVFKLASQQPTSQNGDTLSPVTGTNASPGSWVTVCAAGPTSCFGYHTTDSTLEGGSTRFAPLDSYAALHTTPEEILYSSVPADDTHEVLYRTQVTQLHPAGDYTTDITYIATPVF